MELALATGTKVKYGTRLSEDNQLCTMCLKIKPADEFSKREGGKRKSWCRLCYNVWRRDYRASRSGSIKKTEYRRDNLRRACLKLGITVDRFFELIEEQDNRCAICGNEFEVGTSKSKIPAIDHCHTTGKVRGLLCGKCNTALGLLNDNIDTFYSAITYLRKHSSE